MLASLALAALVGAGAAMPACAMTPAAAARLTLYVSPEGDDRWSGLSADPAADRSDGPLATFEVARDRARAAGGPATVVVRGGNYYLRYAVQFDTHDAGLEIVAAPGERPVLHGGVAVDGWRRESDGSWSAPLAQAPDDVFVGGPRAQKARHPNLGAGGPQDGWLFAAAPGEINSNVAFRYRRGDLPEFSTTDGLVANIVGGFVAGLQWGSDTLPVVAIDRVLRTVHTEGTDYFFTGEGSRYFLTGGRELFDAPREWWYDPQAQRLHYRPDDAGFPATTVVAAVIPTMFRLADADRMRISGLTFRDGSPQGTGKVRTHMREYGAIRLEGADDVRIAANRFENVGVAIHVSESVNARIIGNDIRHTAGNGVYIGTVYGAFGRSDGAQVLGNRFGDIGEVYYESAAIWFQAADRVRIAYNLIDGAAQFGIAGGSLWGDADACHDAVVELNVVNDTNRLTADGGGIKMMGAQSTPQNTLIRRNVVAGTGDLMNRPDGSFFPPRYEDTTEWPSPISWAIYLDGRASGVTIAQNLVVGNVTGIGINGGWSNVVDGNVIVGGTGNAFRIDDATGRDWRPEWGRPNRVENNLASVTRADGRAIDVHAPGHGAGYVAFARNVFVGTRSRQTVRLLPQVMGSGEFGTLADFARTGIDLGSRLVELPGGSAGADR